MTAARLTALATSCIALLGLSALPAKAATVTQCGTSICYTYDDAQAATALFGAPVLVGDSLVFLPGNFRAESLNGAGTDVVSANFIFDEIYTKSGVAIKDIVVVETGDYDIIGGDEVGADLLLTVTDLNPGTGFPPLPQYGSSLTSFTATGDSGGQQEWDLTGIFSAEDEFEVGTDRVTMSMQNTLTAIANDPTDSAWIQKKLTLTVVTPVPAAMWMFGSALIVLGWVRRRRSA